MDSFKVAQTKEIEDREALKQMQAFLKREEQLKAQDTATEGLDRTRIDDTTLQQLKTVQSSLQEAQSR